VVTGGSALVALTVGPTHACALRDDHVAMCWGENVMGAAGEPAGSDQTAPKPITGTWKTIDVGDETSCALDENGAPFCWGNGSHGQLGNGMTVASSVPVAVCREMPCPPI
jgi:alpha-tubulin suppressor-like RCC1 family protein